MGVHSASLARRRKVVTFITQTTGHHPVCMPSKNFLTHHQLDVHFCTEFLCTLPRHYGPSRLVCINNGRILLVNPS